MKNLHVVIPAVLTLAGLMSTVIIVAAPVEDTVVSSAPTPYSNDHAVAARRGTESEAPDTF